MTGNRGDIPRCRRNRGTSSGRSYQYGINMILVRNIQGALNSKEHIDLREGERLISDVNKHDGIFINESCFSKDHLVLISRE